MSTYQMGTEALVALGQAKETSGGAVRVSAPRVPDPLPRWDDICVAVLAVMAQDRLIDFRQSDGTVAPPRHPWPYVVRLVAPESPQPNIAAPNGLDPARVTDEAFDLLAALGLVAEGSWTREAETVIWRSSPREWTLDFTHDRRFTSAVDHASTSTPADLRAAIDQLTTVSEADLATSRAKAEESARAHGKPGDSIRPEQIRRSVVFRQTIDLDRRFYRGWRLADGWLPPDTPARPLQIFHDPLAQAMRRAVVSRLHPDRAEFAV